MIVTIILGLICVYLIYTVIRSIKVVVRRWQLGMFRPAVIQVIWVFIFGGLLFLTASARYTNVQIGREYEKFGAQDVAFLGERNGFEKPLVAYTDADTGELCIGERVGGEEFLNELVCLDPQEKED